MVPRMKKTYITPASGVIALHTSDVLQTGSPIVLSINPSNVADPDVEAD